MVDGRIVLVDGRPSLFDGEEVLRAAQAVALGLWRRAGHAPKAHTA
jgi:5-methylthioadenosine/S-adenosylhomocysteine deaminase